MPKIINYLNNTNTYINKWWNVTLLLRNVWFAKWIKHPSASSVCIDADIYIQIYILTSGWGGWRCQGHISVMKSSPPTHHVRPKKFQLFRWFEQLLWIDIQAQQLARCAPETHRDKKLCGDKSTLIYISVYTWETFIVFFFGKFLYIERIVCNTTLSVQQSIAKHTYIYMRYACTCTIQWHLKSVVIHMCAFI